MKLNYIPTREQKPRLSGVTMVMDKGLYDCQAEGLCNNAAQYIDYVKLGFGTSILSGSLTEKLKIYRGNGLSVYPGGTLFEAFYIRGMVDEYEEFIRINNFDTIEISDGSIIIDHVEKCELISRFATKYTVLSEVGSKIAGANISTTNWIEMMTAELNAGSKFVIAEAREAGNLGIFDSKGVAKQDMIDEIADKVSLNKVIWEAPTKSQQVWFVKHFGANVNLGNIPAEEVLALETVRQGLRGDTFGHYLPEELNKFVQK